MMLGAISAEMLKLTRHRMSWGLIWIYPLGLTIIFVLFMIATLVNGGEPETGESAATWVNDAASFWAAPSQSVVRILIAGFVVIAFAGEYGWNTWKLVVPHCSRARLITAKYVVTIALFLISFILAAWLMTLYGWIEDLASGDEVPAGITAGALIEAHWLGLLTILPPLLLTIAYASLASVLTRSTVAALVVSIVLITLEQAVANLAPLAAIRFPGAAWTLFHVLPGYHLANILEWIVEAKALEVAFPSGRTASLSLLASIGVVAAWIGALVGLTYWRFGRQDIN